MARGARSRTSKRRIEQRDDMVRVLDARREGKTIREIAVALEMPRSTVHRLLEQAIEEIPAESVEALRREVLERELGLIESHWPSRSDPDSAKVIQASHKILMDLHGLAAPTKSEVTGKDGAPLIAESTAHDDVLRGLAALADAARARSGDPKPDA